MNNFDSFDIIDVLTNTDFNDWNNAREVIRKCIPSISTTGEWWIFIRVRWVGINYNIGTDYAYSEVKKWTSWLVLFDFTWNEDRYEWNATKK